MNSNFQKLKFKIFDLPPDADLLEHFPELARYKTFTKSKAAQKNLLLRYMIFMYDPGSDLISDISDLQKRKVRAAELAGFKQESDYLTSIFEFTDKAPLEFMHCFLTQVFHNRKYTEWQTLMQELEENTRLRWEPITTKKMKKSGDKEVEDVDVYSAADKKSKLRDHSYDIHKMIDAIEKEIFGDNKDVQEIAIKARFISPESFAGVAA